ncbi:Fe-S-containing hydro-lyase [Desulfotomaculum nigrificans]|uniref:Fe-S-containing hydro-lyase n=1 Tax=Desulfotomaculum nigrificans TaxID=1565 RepID=UPI0001FAE797|nr:Fe-S-containing hydro-lyase [Desulfotomaculum nigrificans]
MTRVSLTTPLSNEVVANLRIGQQVSISGVIYTARDAAHKRLVELLDKGAELPIDLNGQIIYYVGPAPAPPGRVIGSAGPTTAGRMDAYAPRLIAKGLKGMIGKGARSEAVIEAMKKYKAVYFAAIGGAAALISKCIVEAEVVAYPELGPEAIYRMVVKDFPAIVVNDAFGGDLYQEGRKLYAGE